MKGLRNLGLSAFIALTFIISAAAQVEVTSPAGPIVATTNYATLADAFAAVNLGTVHTGAITINVVADTSEPALGVASATLNAGNDATPADYTSIVIKPVGARTISGTASSGFPLIDFNGADNVTIDGLNDGTNTLTIQNLNALAVTSTSTVRFIGGATGNTITNSNVLGSASMSVLTNGGTIYFATDAVTTAGNDNNTISNNNIGPAGAALPTKGIYGNGSTTTTAIGNSGIVINNNNIFDYFGAAVTSAGVTTQGGCNTWSITGNRLYQTAARIWTTGANNRGIEITSTTALSGAQGFTITGNIIGYATNTQTGTYTLSGSTGKFMGIQFSGITGGTVSNINNNTVASVSLTGVTSSGIGTGSPMTGILVTNGLANTNGNTIGSQTATGSLVLSMNSTTSTETYGIYNFSVDDWTANMNNIGGISTTNLAASGTQIIYGLRANTSGTKVMNAMGNNVGGTIANSIQLTATGVGSQVVGMQTPQAIATFTLNNIRNLTNNIGTGTTTTASVAGIIFTSTTPNQTVSQNTISNLTNTNATAASVVTGIQFTGGTANLVQRNLITGLFVATNSTAAEVNGIRVAGGTTVYRNNMINIGAGISNAIGTGNTTGGINGFNEALGTNTVSHNSIYIGGVPTAGVGPSYAFNGSQTTNTRAFRDNIFFNARSNAGSTGINFGVRVGGSAPNPGGLTVNNNVYFANGAGAVFGFFNNLPVANLAAWQLAVGQDAASLSADPLFVSTTDIHLGAGSPAIDVAFNLGVTNDFDGDSRPGLNALYDIGADERDGIPAVANDMQATAFIDPANGGSKLTGSTFSPQASFTNNGTAGQTAITVRYRICSDLPCTTVIYNNTFVIPSLATITSTNVTFPSTSIATPGTYFIRAKAELVGDTVPANDEIAGTLNVLAPLAGTYTVGSGGNFTSLTNAGGVFDALNNLGASAPVVINIISDMTGETGATALNPIAGSPSVLIKPSGAARTISGIAPIAVIRINGADNIRIDGSTTASIVGGNASLRELTVQNLNTVLASAAVISLQSGVDGAQNNTIQNVNVLGNDPTQTLIGISIAGATPSITGTGADNDNNRIINCSVKRAIVGIYTAGTSAANQNTGTVINQNDLSATTVDRIRRVGITVSNENGVQITENSVGGIDTTESNDAIGIGVGTQDISSTATTSGNVTNANVNRNRINGVVSSPGTFSAAGIAVAGGTTGPNIISNNMITGVSANSTSPDITAGIFVAGVTGSTTRLFYNSVSMTGDRGVTATQMPSYAVAISGVDPTVELKNNIFYTTQIASGGGVNAKSYAIGMFTTTFVNLDSNYNLFFSTGANDGGFRSGSLAAGAGLEYATVALWSAAVADDTNSVIIGEVDPLFLNPLNNLRLTPITSPVLDKGTPVSVLDDFDGSIRSVSGFAGGVPDLGGDEIAAPTAASANVRGRVVTPLGRGLMNAFVILTNTNTGETRYARTTTLGYFNIQDLPVGNLYIVNVNSKRYRFDSQSFTLTEDLDGLVLTGQ
jgi:trimeric autotransporter adhesin